MTRPRSDSSSVTSRCGQSEPDVTQSAMRPAISLGRLKKNGSIAPAAAPACHAATTLRPSATRQNRIAARLGSGTAGRALAFEDLLAQDGPDRPIDVDEFMRGAEVEQITRAG